MEDNIKNREVIRKIKVGNKCTYWMQALLEDTGMVVISLGDSGSLTLFYDVLMEKEIISYIEEIEKFCKFEKFDEKLYNNSERG